METFRLGTCNNYVRGQKKEYNNDKVGAGWVTNTYDWDKETVEKLFSTEGTSGGEFKDGIRKNEQWVQTNTIILDKDDDTYIAGDMVDMQEKLQFNTYLCSSQNHQRLKNEVICDRVHMVIPLAYPIDSEYDFMAVKAVLLNNFKGIDKSCLELVRYIAHGTTEVSSLSSDKGMLAWKDLPGLYKGLKPRDAWDKDHAKKVPEFRATDMVRTYEDKIVAIKTIKKHTAVHCPMCEHIYKRNRSSDKPNAFIAPNSSGLLILSCSSCGSDTVNLGIGGTGLYEMSKEDLMKDYWMIEDKAMNVGFCGDSFSLAKMAKETMFATAGLNHMEKKGRERVLEEFNVNKYIRHLDRVDHVSNTDITENFYEIDKDMGRVTAHHKPIEVKIKDNAFWDKYLETTFNGSSKTMKEWLAVYFHSNYKKLPTMILTGPRGTGKSVFANTIAKGYPTLSIAWNGGEGSFNDEVEKKLLVVEENAGNATHQYRTLKSYSGSGMVRVNKKFLPAYTVQNNMNIMILSNQAIAVFADKDELPTDSTNNQFLVYEMHPPKERITNIEQMLTDRLGHYIDTELRSTYLNLPVKDYRYSIDVPITEAEKTLFSGSTTTLNDDVREFLFRLEDLAASTETWDDSAKKALVEGWVSNDLIKDLAQKTGSKPSTLKNKLIGKKLLVDEVSQRGGRKGRVRCYKAGTVLLVYIADLEFMGIGVVEKSKMFD